jgi:hypothetical protein
MPATLAIAIDAPATDTEQQFHHEVREDEQKEARDASTAAAMPSTDLLLCAAGVDTLSPSAIALIAPAQG